MNFTVKWVLFLSLSFSTAMAAEHKRARAKVDKVDCEKTRADAGNALNQWAAEGGDACAMAQYYEALKKCLAEIKVDGDRKLEEIPE